MNARVTEATLSKAARVAAAEGVSIVIRVGKATYEITPVEKPVEKAQGREAPEPW